MALYNDFVWKKFTRASKKILENLNHVTNVLDHFVHLNIRPSPRFKTASLVPTNT